MMQEQQLSHQAFHQSVLLREVVEALSPADDAIYLDATFGNGGYSRALLEAANCKVKMLHWAQLNGYYLKHRNPVVTDNPQSKLLKRSCFQ